MREVQVRARWESTHTIEVPDDTPRIRSDDLAGLLDAAEDDVTSDIADLVDWDITDPGPAE